MRQGWTATRCGGGSGCPVGALGATLRAARALPLPSAPVCAYAYACVRGGRVVRSGDPPGGGYTGVPSVFPMSTGTVSPATTTLPARIREALASGDAVLCGRLYDWVADHDDETMAREHGLPRTAVLVLLADVADR